jgi:Ca2+-transporting ATPase
MIPLQKIPDTTGMSKNTWHSLDITTIFNKLSTSRKSLNEDEAAQRLETYGTNELMERKSTTLWKIFFRQFTGVLVIILLISATVSAFISYARASVITPVPASCHRLQGLYYRR